MNDNGPRWLRFLIVLIVGFALGVFFRGSTGGRADALLTPPLPTVTPSPIPVAATPTCVPWGVQGTKSVVVGPDIRKCNPDCLRINKNDTVVWAGVTTDDLWIEFEEKPFQTMSSGTIKPNRADCAGNTCRSGPVVATAPAGSYPCPNDPTRKCKEYKYWQVFHNPVTNGNNSADGRIIIKW